MNGHVLTFRADNLQPGYGECLRCQRRMKLHEYVTTACDDPTPEEEERDETSRSA